MFSADLVFLKSCRFTALNTKNINVIFSKPEYQHPNCLVVSKEGLMRFYPDGDTLDPEIGKKRYIAAIKVCLSLESNKSLPFCVQDVIKGLTIDDPFSLQSS